MIDLKSVFPQRRDGALVYEECLDRGLIDPDARELTSKGLIVARAKVLTRTPYAKARSILMDVLDSADRLNADPDAISNISQIWLFGSFMRGENTVGDIDLALVPVRAPAFSDNFEGLIEQAKRRIAQLPDAPSQWAYPWDRVDWLFRRAIFGARRHPLLAGAQTGTTDLASLGVPCQLIYDQVRGGRVDDPILPMHPESKGRDASMEPPPSMPDFHPVSLRPMDARWLAGHR
ncbi:MAG: nucleotidyltransferase domain-containing protein, partial [Sphingobium sp.]